MKKFTKTEIAVFVFLHIVLPFAIAFIKAQVVQQTAVPRVIPDHVYKRPFASTHVSAMAKRKGN